MERLGPEGRMGDLSAAPTLPAHTLVCAQPVLSPLEGTKMTVNNLHPRVTEEDIVVSTACCTL